MPSGAFGLVQSTGFVPPDAAPANPPQFRDPAPPATESPSSAQALPIQTVNRLVLASPTGWLLVIGKSLILPIFAAVIAVYVLPMAADAIEKLPLLDRLSPFIRQILVVIAFIHLAAKTLINAVLGAVSYLIMRELGWTPKIPFEQSLAETMAALKVFRATEKARA